MAQMPPLRTIANETPVDATDPEYNFSAIEDHVRTELVNRDGSVSMQAELVLAGTPSSASAAVPKSYVDSLIPIGVMWEFGGAVAPPGWAFCRGQPVSTTDPVYEALFAVIGYSFGGAGGTFNLPDRRDRFGLGAGSTYDVGDTGGSTDVAAHTHTASFAGTAMPTHFHAMPTHSHGDGSLLVNIDHNHASFSISGGLHDHDTWDGAGGFTYYAIRNNPGSGDIAVGSGTAFERIAMNLLNTSDSTTHNHTVDVPALGTTNKNVTGTTQEVDPGDTVSKSAGTPSGTVTVNTDGTGDNRGPWVAVNYIIKL